ncbi:acyl-CoA ligase (AMP-forming), exosortase A system-associated [Paraglaciecola arctica]|uniref:Acyl-CoA ligase (AMP-forming), exosortase system type 1 associated n=1 Tax=Paraglaciecola arctica BSs20135 TaxID=493475 RepID=K6ZF08_9ALTE|nr:acyl-CoA ligase (AMP-forming), exosortase A system-associated [Paraglaciecola arctica]GAC21995.1 acyl-CoA ligase (AMP-forming), exosortase system type 1 associated [Paraglaciecola arctica BSs20135]
MVTFFDELISYTASVKPNNQAIIYKQQSLSYALLDKQTSEIALGLSGLGLQRSERVAVFLPKLPVAVMCMFAATRANGTFVPINSVLKALQVQHILNDCNVKVLVTSSDRLKALSSIINQCPDLKHVVLIDKLPAKAEITEIDTQLSLLAELPAEEIRQVPRVENDMAAILYTSGSTGKPKGVVLSHRNLVCGAHSVSSYLHNDESDVILALLPISFDAGLSQITTAFFVGASCVLMDYFLPGDVVKTIEKHKVTGLTAVPPLWQQLMKINWPDSATAQLRYFANTGGAMPQVTLAKIRDTFKNAAPYLMYGLTEAFRSTYLPPDKVDERIGSMGKAIPNAEIMVVDEDGRECAANEPGELVHRGPLVSLGYWNDVEKTAERFKPVPVKRNGLVLTEMAVWSGDTVKKDDSGYLYFVGRKDEMIKTSGYRVSPMEIEEACYQGAEEVAEAIACGVSNLELGQAIVLLIVVKDEHQISEKDLLNKCKKNLPNFMHPKWLEIRSHLPRNPNGKVDRSMLSKEMKEKYSNK